MLFHSTKTQGGGAGMFPVQAEGMHRQWHAARACQAVAEVLKAHEILLTQNISGYGNTTTGASWARRLPFPMALQQEGWKQGKFPFLPRATPNTGWLPARAAVHSRVS